MNDSVSALTQYNTELIAGGSFTTAGEHVSAFWARWGRSCPADLDGDGDADLFDFELFLDCLTGPGGGPPESGCECGDFDADDDIDFDDFGAFQNAFTGP